ncbi:hypothetical protein EXT51_03395 [Pectobacterium carotovorum subsp. carotovorum]|uniref:hypothetical protein n=1 Tax=Pectobacterium carotovorum TaxID=554 RepID=UPI00202D1C43|nr:hypothetical protein [Pectobacterium carotovorum]MCL6328548.1 hypothetical protein [Pectobacterium carotovorum subsp. carotovorum]
MMGDVGDHYRDLKPFLKERRRKARDGAYERIKAFFIKNGVQLEEGNNTLIFRTPLGTVCYYPPSQKMQHKNFWKECSPTFCMNYVLKLRGLTNDHQHEPR